jgi:eukaryotic-like serine/threonine-protein kinase
VSDLRTTLEQRRRAHVPDPGAFDRLVRRRRRKDRTKRLATIVVALAIAAAGIWPLVHGGSFRAGPAAPIIDRSTVGRLDVAWTAAVGGATAPVIAGDLAFVGSQAGILYALDVRSGGVVWLGRLGGPIASEVAVSGDRVFVHTTDGVLAAFDMSCGVGGATCLPSWTARTGGEGAPPLAAGDLVLVSTGKRLLAFDATCGTGGEMCEPSWTGVARPLDGTGPSAAPARADGTVWTVIGVDAAIFPMPCLAAEGGRCEALNYRFTGSLRTGPVVGGGMAYLGSTSGYVYGYRADCTDTCDAIWRALATDPTEPAVAGGVVYVSGAPDGGLAAIPQDCRSDGTACAPTWTGDIHGSPTSRVVVSNGVVYVGSSDGNLYAFPATCEAPCAPVGVIRIGASIEAPAIWQDRAILVTARDGTLRALSIDGRDL